MPFHIIHGTFHVQGYSPDGDSIRFQALDNANWKLLSGPPAKKNARGHVQLRLEAIDTLETHFENKHQPLLLAEAALVHLLNILGITNVVWDANHTTVLSADDGVPGFILTREVEKNGRPVAFAFAGTPPEPDGSPVFVTPAMVEISVNAEMLRSGLAYPTYYQGLFSDLRQALTDIVAIARLQNRGVWEFDVTNTGFAVTGLSSITDQHVILPKLFRRLASYLQAGGSVSGFVDFLEDGQEEILIISAAHATHFDTIVRVNGDVVRMTELPENVVFRG